MTVLSRRQSLAAIGLGVAGLSACSPRSIAPPDVGQSPDDIDMALVARNSAVFWFTGVSDNSRARHHLEFFWSPSCMFSARKFRDHIYPLVSDTRFMRDHAVSGHMMVRNSRDLRTFRQLRRFREFGALASALMFQQAKQSRLLTDGEISDLARRANAVPAAGAVDDNHALILTGWARQFRGVSGTPETFLDGKRITIG